MAACIFNLGVTYWDFQVCHQPKKKLFISGQIYKKDKQWAKTNEKSFLWFLFCELWSILYTKFIEKITNFEYKKDHISKIKNLQKSENWFFIRFNTFCFSKFHVNMNTFEVLGKTRHFWWGFAPPPSPTPPAAAAP